MEVTAWPEAAAPVQGSWANSRSVVRWLTQSVSSCVGTGGVPPQEAKCHLRLSRVQSQPALVGPNRKQAMTWSAMPFDVSQASPLQSTGQRGEPRQSLRLQSETAFSVSAMCRTSCRITSYAASAVVLIWIACSNVRGTAGVTQLMIADAQLVPGLPLLSVALPLASSTRALSE